MGRGTLSLHTLLSLGRQSGPSHIPRTSRHSREEKGLCVPEAALVPCDMRTEMGDFGAEVSSGQPRTGLVEDLAETQTDLHGQSQSMDQKLRQPRQNLNFLIKSIY